MKITYRSTSLSLLSVSTFAPRPDPRDFLQRISASLSSFFKITSTGPQAYPVFLPVKIGSAA